jgi:hypothetical protein
MRCFDCGCPLPVDNFVEQWARRHAMQELSRFD